MTDPDIPYVSSSQARGPREGDRVEVTLEGVVRVRHDGKYPSVQIKLDNDVLSVGSECDECDEEYECLHARREAITTFAAPDAVVIVERAGGDR